jgi:diacylglycerol kinase (ATP)
VIAADTQTPGSPRAAGRRFRVIYNPSAGTKGGLPIASRTTDVVRATMAEHDLGDDLVVASSETVAAEASRAAVAAGVEVVVAAGGDGTASLVADQLLGTASALGILPMGSVMNIARSLGISRDLDQAAEVLSSGTEIQIDVGETAGKAFYEAGSVGLNAAIFREAAHFDDPDWLSIVRCVWVAIRYRPARMVIQLDDRLVRTRALMVAISNGQFLGAGMTVAPDARLDDGMFDVRVFRGFSKWELLRHLASIAFGRRRYSPRISTFRSRNVRVSSVHPLPARADQRDLGSTPVEFRTRPRALRVITGSRVDTVPGQETTVSRGGPPAGAA